MTKKDIFYTVWLFLSAGTLLLVPNAVSCIALGIYMIVQLVELLKKLPEELKAIQEEEEEIKRRIEEGKAIEAAKSKANA